ncbi:unnamed protein product [Rotaria sp. Silwood1]|nr:unnamed protein product [Rotaria sp. Silwood1]
MQSTLQSNHTITETTKASDYKVLKQSSKFPPYSITFKRSPQVEQVTDRKLLELLLVEWKDKNNYVPDITGRFGHGKCLLIFANDETSFEELFNQQNWPTKINDCEFDLKIPRVSPSIYSLVIQQFFNSWNIEEVFEDLKTLYPTLIKLTRMYSFNNKPLNLVRADFCSLQQVKKLLDDGRITIDHMKNLVKQYHPPAKISKCMKCYSHHHSTNECTSQVQLCIRCSLDHPYNNNCQNEIKCINCGQDHYAGHSACPEVQQIRRQISQNQREKRTQLLINLEQDQQLHYNNNNQSFPQLPSTSIQQQQQQPQRYSSQPQTYASILQAQTQHQQQPHKNDRNHVYIENILTTFSNKIEYRLQQFEERLINQVIEVEKIVDNLKSTTCELETVIFETILPSIKAIQECSFVNTRSTSTREDLTRYKNEVTNLLTRKNNNNNNTKPNKSNTSDNRTKGVPKTIATKQTPSTLFNDSE